MVSFYDHPVQHIDDLSPYFEYDPKSFTMRFIGSTLEVRVCKRFETYGLLSVTDHVETLAFADLIIDEKYQKTLILPAKIQMEYTATANLTILNVPYLAVFLRHGQLFMTSTQMVKDANIVYALWVEFLTRGNMLYTLGYEDQAQLFDRAKSMCDMGLGVDHSILEMITAYLARDPDYVQKSYRLTAMDRPPQIVPLRSVSTAPDNTTARLLGSYHDEGFNASLVQTVTDVKPFEQLMRGLPMPERPLPDQLEF